MPIYDYKCRGCGSSFEMFVRSGTGEAPACPACQSRDLEQLVSAFAVNSQERSKSAFQVAKRHAEKGIREQQIAQQDEWKDHH
jgi:putative FmdB family regulatory protein